jgi:hypothetical protein
MDNPKNQQHGGPNAAENRTHRSSWQRMHRSPFFWVAAVCLLLGMIVYVITNNLAFWPGEPAQAPMPAVAP